MIIDKCQLILVEAGGVEPPSEKATTETSPGAAESFRFRLEAADPTRYSLASSMILAYTSEHWYKSVLVCVTPAPASQVKPGLDGYLIKQRKRNYCWQLMPCRCLLRSRPPQPAISAIALPVETGRPRFTNGEKSKG